MQIELSAMISQLRREIRAAQLERQSDQIPFSVDEIDLEIQFTVTKETQGKAAIKFWIEAGGAASQTTANIQKLRLKLSPPPNTQISGSSGRPK